MTGILRFRLVALLSGLLLMAGTAHAQLEGTLFTQPEERVYLDYLRQEYLRSQEGGFDIQVVEIPEIPVDATPAETTGPSEVTFGGIMTRRNGGHSIWLDGRLLAERELPEGYTLVAQNQSLSLRIAHEGSIFMLRPGQTVHLATGAIAESFQRTPEPEGSPAETAAATPQNTETTAEPGEVIDAPGEAVVEPNADPATEREVPDPVAPLAEAILQLTSEQGNQLIETLNAAAEEAGNEADDEEE